MPDLTGAVWRKSARSNNGGNCVEVTDNLPDIVGVRDSKDTSGPVLTYESGAWAHFIAAVRRGNLDR
ncbi:DUF397 domain-containing protein [Micromonospora sp. NPDC048830]|uniref:DUF397 domain-containing protein n=1 Tax=Micromonospora sp. NPDC048830 TaxID=3364257 RepID=UPI0037111ED8